VPAGVRQEQCVEAVAHGRVCGVAAVRAPESGADVSTTVAPTTPTPVAAARTVPTASPPGTGWRSRPWRFTSSSAP
jgi:hypothetical protein